MDWKFFLILVSVLIIFTAIDAFSIIAYRTKLSALQSYVDNLLNNIILNSDLVDSSIETICTTYKVERGDLMDWISKNQGV